MTLSSRERMMTETRYDVLGLGNAIVDVIARTDDDFLATHNLNKGAMTLIEESRAEALFHAMGPAEIVSGGCAANTASGVASLGGRAAFIGKVRKDTLGELFAQNIRAFGVDFETMPASSGPATARSFIMVTPGWRADHEHLSRRLPGARPRGCGRQSGGNERLHLSRGLSLGPPARQGGIPQGRAASPMGQGEKSP